MVKLSLEKIYQKTILFESAVAIAVISAILYVASWFLPEPSKQGGAGVLAFVFVVILGGGFIGVVIADAIKNGGDLSKLRRPVVIILAVIIAAGILGTQLGSLFSLAFYYLLLGGLLLLLNYSAVQPPYLLKGEKLLYRNNFAITWWWLVLPRISPVIVTNRRIRFGGYHPLPGIFATSYWLGKQPTWERLSVFDYRAWVKNTGKDFVQLEVDSWPIRALRFPLILKGDLAAAMKKVSRIG